MGEQLKLTIDSELLKLVDARRGTLSRQAYILGALLDKLQGSPVEQELRAQNERLLQLLTGERLELPATPQRTVEREQQTTRATPARAEPEQLDW